MEYIFAREVCVKSTHARTHMRTYIHACTHTHTHARKQASKQASKQARTHARTHAHTHTHTGGESIVYNEAVEQCFSCGFRCLISGGNGLGVPGEVISYDLVK